MNQDSVSACAASIPRKTRLATASGAGDDQNVAIPANFALNRGTLFDFDPNHAREAFTVLGAISFAGPLLALAAWAWIIATIRSTPLRQGKHDMLAGGTRVIRLHLANHPPAVHKG